MKNVLMMLVALHVGFALAKDAKGSVISAISKAVQQALSETGGRVTRQDAGCSAELINQFANSLPAECAAPALSVDIEAIERFDPNVTVRFGDIFC